MVTNLCFCLTCLLVPLMFELFNLQASLSISNIGHTVIEVFIICTTYWLLVQILRLDNNLYLRSLDQQESFLDHVEPAPSARREKPAQHQETAFDWTRVFWRNLIKSRRTVKP